MEENLRKRVPKQAHKIERTFKIYLHRPMLFAPALVFAPLILLFTMSMPDFSTRATMFGIASQEEVMKLANQPNTVVLDVRSVDEVQSGKVECPGWVHCSVTPMGAPELEQDPEAIVGSDKAAPIIIYCGSGKRASIAKGTLEAKGYTNVVNAGGLCDVGYLGK